ncbi:type IV secretion system protein [Bisgaard Taxon 10/6]|uniref:type IV secretion system protein n=1 Tax=Exercitatus varius TaxID=67857 RepID=UPI00294B3B20|nr:type IV secretion system protein [Exercitatus varius]MDG2957046.1 type IV secretion system protein [Exercitatus varius]MDG2965266.1 type IV secretion system protein [Exercitatus varius]
MKHIIKPTFIAMAIVLSANQSFAGGIPTVDGATLAAVMSGDLQQLAQLKQQLEAAQTQIQQYQTQIQQYRDFANDTKRRFEGNMNIADLLRGDSFLNSIPDLTNDVISLTGESLSQLRESYSLVSDNPEVQKQFDKLISYTDYSKKYLKKIESRIKNLDNLKALADAAQTPAQKQDVANKLAIEKLRYDQEQLAMSEAEKKFERNFELQRRQAIEEYKKGESQKAATFRAKFGY